MTGADWDGDALISSLDLGLKSLKHLTTKFTVSCCESCRATELDFDSTYVCGDDKVFLRFSSPIKIFKYLNKTNQLGC